MPAVSDALGVARRLPSGTRGVALTFDDGPHAEGTPALLDLLGESGTRATFFLIGEQVERLPRVAERIAREGHTVALHGYRHRNRDCQSHCHRYADCHRNTDRAAGDRYPNTHCNR